MHNREKAEYQDFLKDFMDDMKECVRLAKAAGIEDDKIILDPGVGFGKTYEMNLEIIDKMEILNELGYPVLLGTSRKSVIGLTLDLPVTQQRRWDKDYRIMKEVYDKSMVGDMYIIKSQLYGVNGNMHDWHIYPEMGGGMLYDWGVHLIDQMLDMVKSKIVSLYADVQNVINENVDDYFKIIMKFENGVTAEIELGTYYLTPKRAWFIGGNKGSALIDGFAGEGKIVRTAHLLENVPGKITMTAAGPTRSFGPPEPGLLSEEPDA
jgi:hypothetical protein